MTSTLRRSEGAPSGRHVREQPAKPAKFRPDIEGLRAFAVLSVVLYHAGLLGVHGGFVGVDVFFVISGFLITRLLLESVGEHGIRALPTFYARRIRRLLPAAMTVVVATVVAARVWAPALSVRPIAIDGIFTTFYGLNYRLAVEGTQYLNQGNAASPLQHFWSLAVEEQFYLCWPILIVLVVFLGRRHRNVLLGLLLAAIVAGVVLLLGDRHQQWTPHGPTSRWPREPGNSASGRSWRSARPSWRGCRARSHWPEAGWRWPRCSPPRSSTATGRRIRVRPRRSRSSGPPCSSRAVARVSAVWECSWACGHCSSLGRMSYSWYLWHWPMLVIAPMILGHALGWPERLAVVAASLAAAFITFKLIENPARSLQLPDLQWFAGGLALSGSAVVAALVVMANPPSLVGTGADATVVHASTATPTVTREMRAAIVAGLNTTAAPRNLTPQPAQAHGDVPSSSYDGCHASLFAVTQGPCVFGDRNGKYTVVLLGDSHMQQWQPTFTGPAPTPTGASST